MLQSWRNRRRQENYSTVHSRFKLVITFFMIFLAFENVLLSIDAERLSGFYVDNGIDQTVVQKTTMHTIKREIASELLNVLDLPGRPRRIARKATMVKRSAPKFLLNIYSTILYDIKFEQTNPSVLEEFNLTNQDISVIDRSDVIMTFGAYNPHMSHEPRNNRGRRIWFDVSEVPVGERILAAELKLYRMLSNDSVKDNTSYTISVYRVSRTPNGERKKHYMDSIHVAANQEGWIKLNITEALQNWVSNSEENKGLFIAAYRSGSFKRIMRPDDIGIVGISGIPDKEPFMVSYFENSGAYKNIARHKRSTRRKEQKYTSLDIRKNLYVTGLAMRKNTDICNVRTLYVSFKDLQWQDWVIAPEGFEANYCKGHCNFPLKTNATNHAILQTLVHLVKPEADIPTPCCAPTKLSPMSVLYFLDHSNVVLKKYKNMVVDSCGCH